MIIFILKTVMVYIKWTKNQTYFRVGLWCLKRARASYFVVDAPVRRENSMESCVMRTASWVECVSVSKMKIFAAILFTFSVQFTSLISAQEFSFGRCGPFPTVKQFDPQRVRILKFILWKLLLTSFFQYSGRWFEYSNYFAFFQLFGKCVTANYRVLPSNPLYGNNVEIEVINKAINSM